jgi:hypothetical protein
MANAPQPHPIVEQRLAWLQPQFAKEVVDLRGLRFLERRDAGVQVATRIDQRFAEKAAIECGGPTVMVTDRKGIAFLRMRCITQRRDMRARSDRRFGRRSSEIERRRSRLFGKACAAVSMASSAASRVPFDLDPALHDGAAGIELERSHDRCAQRNGCRDDERKAVVARRDARAVPQTHAEIPTKGGLKELAPVVGELGLGDTGLV